MLSSIVLVTNGSGLGAWGFAEFTVACTLSHAALWSRGAFNGVRASRKRKQKRAACGIFSTASASWNEFRPAFCETTEMCFIKGRTGEPLWDPSLAPSCPSLLGKTESQRNVSPTSCTQERAELRLAARFASSLCRKANKFSANFSPGWQSCEIWRPALRTAEEASNDVAFLCLSHDPVVEVMLSSFVQSGARRCWRPPSHPRSVLSPLPPPHPRHLSLVHGALRARLACCAAPDSPSALVWVPCGQPVLLNWAKKPRKERGFQVARRSNLMPRARTHAQRHVHAHTHRQACHPVCSVESHLERFLPFVEPFYFFGLVSKRLSPELGHPHNVAHLNIKTHLQALAVCQPLFFEIRGGEFPAEKHKVFFLHPIGASSQRWRFCSQNVSFCLSWPQSAAMLLHSQTPLGWKCCGCLQSI